MSDVFSSGLYWVKKKNLPNLVFLVTRYHIWKNAFFNEKFRYVYAHFVAKQVKHKLFSQCVMSFSENYLRTIWYLTIKHLLRKSSFWGLERSFMPLNTIFVVFWPKYCTYLHFKKSLMGDQKTKKIFNCIFFNKRLIKLVLHNQWGKHKEYSIVLIFWRGLI